MFLGFVLFLGVKLFFEFLFFEFLLCGGLYLLCGLEDELGLVVDLGLKLLGLCGLFCLLLLVLLGFILFGLILLLFLLGLLLILVGVLLNLLFVFELGFVILFNLFGL